MQADTYLVKSYLLIFKRFSSISNSQEAKKRILFEFRSEIVLVKFSFLAFPYQPVVYKSIESVV